MTTDKIQDNVSGQEAAERTGDTFELAPFMAVRRKTRQALHAIAARITPGMREEEARRIAKQTLKELGTGRGWHQVLVRFGPNTLKSFTEPSEPDVILSEDDIFFIDIGPVWQGYEGDAGETFATGPDPEMRRCAEDVRQVFEATRRKWLDDGLTGQQLYQFADKIAQEMGWQLNLKMDGHRLSDFPHNVYHKGTLADVDFNPSTNLWVLEIQIRHPEKNYGAFYEDLLLDDDTLKAPDTGDEKADLVRRAYAGRLMPGVQVNTFRNIDRLFPTRTIARGGSVTPFPRRAEPLQDMPVAANGTTYDLYDYVSRNRVAGLLMLKNGEIALEQYEFGNTEKTRWMSMSMAKSISSTLVGVAIQDGLIGSLDDPLTRYLPMLKDGGYDGVSVRQLLQMTSGVKWDETHTDPASERRHVLELQIRQEPGSILKYMANLPRVAAPGTLWNYSTGETHVVGELLRAATGRSVADYLSEKIWSKLGMEADANWWLEAPGGLEVAGSGISATLRDYARFGLFVMNGGVIDGESILPEGWMTKAAGPFEAGGQQVDYGFMWWPVPGPDGSFDDGAFSARGIFGQYLYLNPKENVVVAVWSARSKPRGAEVILDNDFFNATVAALR